MPSALPGPRLPACAVSVALLAACNGDANLNAGRPSLEVSPTAIDFGEVVVGTQSEIGVTLTNTGYGLLGFSSVSLADGTPADFEIVTVPEGIDHDETGVLGVRYTPDAEGGDAGTAVLVVDVEDIEPVEITLEAIGVVPVIDVDPEVLYFGRVPAGGAVTLPVQVGADGSGDLRISHIGFSGEEDVAYSFSPPDGYEEPYSVANGFTFTLDVTFAPPDDAEYRGELWIESNDPETPVAVVSVIGNTDDVPTEPQAPIVQILDPDNGEFFMDDMDVTLSGHVVDTDEQNIQDLVCTWSVGTTQVGYGAPDAEGNVTSTSTLPAGATAVLLRCFDTTGEMGADTAVVTVFPADEPTPYTISGGDSVFDYLTVDDDLTVRLNGATIYADTDATKNTLAPIEFDAARGDVLEIVLVDQNYCDVVLDALVLHWGTGRSQPLNDAFCSSACADHSCYDASYNGPWPGVVLEEEFTITIP